MVRSEASFSRGCGEKGAPWNSSLHIAMCKPLRRMPNLYKRRVCRTWEEELFFNLLPQSVTCSVKWKIVPSVCALLLPLYRVAISKKRSSKTIVTFTKCVSHAVSSVPLPVLNLNGLPCSLEFRMFNGGRPYMVCQVLWLNLLKLFSSFPKFPKGKFSNSKFTQPIWRTLKASWAGAEVAGPQLRRWRCHKSMQSWIGIQWRTERTCCRFYAAALDQ